jgi:hypothetical protein
MTRISSTIFALLLAACGDAGSVSRSAILRDSAGITIVENPDLALADSLSWWVDTTGVVRIGEVDGAPEYELGDVVGFTRLSDGRIAIADAIAHEVRFFDEHGQFLHKVGSSGSGPGEYEYFHRMLRHRNDSLLVIDHEGGRLNLLASRGESIRSFRVPTTENARRLSEPLVHDVFSDGSLLAIRHIRTGKPYFGAIGIIQDDSAVLSRVTEGGEQLADYGVHLSSRHLLLAARGVAGAIVPVAEVFWDAHGAQLYYAESRTFEVRIHSRDGTLERIVRVAYEPKARTAPVAGLRPEPGANPEQRKMMEELSEALRDADLPERLPAFGQFLVDANGNLWIEEYKEATAPSSRWFVFDTTGVLRYSLRLPKLRLVSDGLPRWRGEIGDDYILGLRYDEDRVQTVHLLPLKKAP